MTNPPLAGVFPVLPTPFLADGSADVDSLRRLVEYLIACGVDGITYPGVASEFDMLQEQERLQLTQVVLEAVAGRVPVIAGATARDVQQAVAFAASAVRHGAAAVMIAAPADRSAGEQQGAYFRAIAEQVPRACIMLQNVPGPVGAGLSPEAIVELVEAVPAIRYVKEETLPSGQRLSTLRAAAPAHLAGVFGGAGGRYITDELRRGAAGTMPAIELAEIHVALYRAHRERQDDRVRELFERMLPVLNIQAVFRWSLTKYVLHRRGLITDQRQRAKGPLLDALDRVEVDTHLSALEGLLLPRARLDALRAVSHG